MLPPNMPKIIQCILSITVHCMHAWLLAHAHSLMTFIQGLSSKNNRTEARSLASKGHLMHIPPKANRALWQQHLSGIFLVKNHSWFCFRYWTMSVWITIYTWVIIWCLASPSAVQSKGSSPFRYQVSSGKKVISQRAKTLQSVLIKAWQNHSHPTLKLGHTPDFLSGLTWL